MLIAFLFGKIYYNPFYYKWNKHNSIFFTTINKHMKRKQVKKKKTYLTRVGKFKAQHLKSNTKVLTYFSNKFIQLYKIILYKNLN